MTPIRRIFIANRGEIAVRIIRTARTLGIETVRGVSEADRESLGAKLATRAVCPGPAPAAQSYLRVETVIEAARGTGCDAIHPGYGFLSENRRLAEACAEEGLIFIVPTPENLAAVGDKLTARAHAEAAGVPLVPGGTVETPGDATRLAEEIGFPLLVKAVAGGGGKGMKRVEEAPAPASRTPFARASKTRAAPLPGTSATARSARSSSLSMWNAKASISSRCTRGCRSSIP